MGSFKILNACPSEHFNFQNALTFVQNRFHLIMCPPDTTKTILPSALQIWGHLFID
jgi:hypothetical protein